ncbi:hypothetical protein GCM10010399_01150 [Dactylosporangium fulvum]|uniref:Rod shape-determining protein n=1 Tax=Dactylosporangium fulvum TaxID=53359 RepID=A0ABY5VPP3_9ACTN|nr:rod shape-determining protein [Dactylosporangium fulvum]UWP79673.1 rod shape-determining protein [Dactylosporangium fulvum]
MINDVISPALASRPAAPAQRLDPAGTAAVQPTAIGVDIGSAYTRIWVSGRPLVHTRTGGSPVEREVVRHGRITDPAAASAMLAGLCGRHNPALPAGAIVVACRPAQADTRDEQALRQTLMAALTPKRLLLIDTVRAAAIGAGAAAGPQLVIDIGAQLVEAAVLARGVVAGVLRHELRIGDVTGPDADDTVVAVVVDLLGRLRRVPQHRPAVAAATRGGLLLVGGGAARPRLAARLTAAVDLPVRRPAAPHLVAVRGAGLAALAALRRAAMHA